MTRIAPLLLLSPLLVRPVPAQGGADWEMIRLDLTVHVLPWEKRAVVEGRATLRFDGDSSPGPSLVVNARQPLMTFEDLRAPRDVDVELNARFPSRPEARLAHLRGEAPYGRGEQLELTFRYASEGTGRQFAVHEQVAFASWTEGWYPFPVPMPGERMAIKSAAPGRTTFHLPAGWRSVSNGRIVERSEDESEVVETWELDRPVARSFAAAPYRVSVHNVDGREIGVYRLGEGSGDVQAEMVAGALAAQEARFGPYPYSSYRIAEIPPVAGDFMASSEQGLILAKSICFAPADGNLALFGHEMAHGWWGNLVGSEGPASILLSESLAQYSAALAIEGLEGRAAMTEFMRFSRPGYIPQQCARGYFGMWRQGVDKPLIELTSGGVDHQLSDAKGHWLHHMLRRRVGDEVFFATMRGILADFKGSEFTLHDLRTRFAAAAPDAELETFFEQWLNRAGAPILDVDWEAVEGGTSVTITQAQAGEPYQLYLDVAVDGSAGTRVHRVDLRERELTVILACEGQPQGVRLDPEHELLIWHPDYGERPE